MNLTILAAVLPLLAGGPPKAEDAPALSDDRLEREVEPYLAPGEAKAGLLLVVDQINKEEGVIAHYVLFHRDTGVVIKSERSETRPAASDCGTTTSTD